MTDIYLRELERADLADINRWRADPQLIAQLGAPFRHVGGEVDERWFDSYLASRASNVRLAICTADRRMVGAAYLLNIEWIHRNAEFAIWIGAADALGKGIGLAATHLTLQHAFRDLNLERVYLSVLPQNQRAIDLYRKVGFVEEGRQRRAVFKEGQYHELLMMGLLRAEYATATATAT